MLIYNKLKIFFKKPGQYFRYKNETFRRLYFYTSKFLHEGDKITGINSGSQNTKAGVVKVLAPKVRDSKKIANSIIKETKFSLY